ncbi:unnamed protein product [Caenorhabditis auriculariae]|uniref:Uncharacterized protein n=1 Tax=Caenorhabditis auriculariae TaxID=2777116 RepID=A0A8S1H2A6_9PELO|nr:unnamed protein product [Caenorhabditis auriculariae]
MFQSARIFVIFAWKLGKTVEEPILARGTAKPPPEWGCKPNEEIKAYLNSPDRCPRYVEKVPVIGARPPMEPKPLRLPSIMTK